MTGDRCRAGSQQTDSNQSKSYALKTPVGFFIFNRPEQTASVFAAIARARPAKLLIVADGPRSGYSAEAEACRATRAVVERVDWDCEVLKNYADDNLGCKRRVSSGLDWLFDQVDSAIILEDDCLPHPSFFPFCEELLERYQDDERIMSISGSNFQFGLRRTDDSYYYSRYAHIWGWASWRRAWGLYDVEMKLWPELRETEWLLAVLDNEEAVGHWRQIFDEVYFGRNDTWDYQWNFACWTQHALAVSPEVNLVSNIGWGSNSTHTGNTDSLLSNIPEQEITFPLKHPNCVWPHREADRFYFERSLLWYGYEPTLYRRWHRKTYQAMSPPARKFISYLRAKLR